MNEKKEYYYFLYEDEMISKSTKKITQQEAFETKDEFDAIATIPNHLMKSLIKFYNKNNKKIT